MSLAGEEIPVTVRGKLFAELIINEVISGKWEEWEENNS
jgi:hypothetical protein